MIESSLRARVAALAESEPALADDLLLRGALIEIVDLAEVRSAEVRLPADVVRARLAGGVPLLDRLDLPVPTSATALLDRLAVAMLVDPVAREPAEAVVAALRSHRLHAQQLVGEAAVGHDDHLAALADAATVPAARVASLADLVARSVLYAVAGRLRPALTLGSWDRGYCPICGGRPIFGERPPGPVQGEQSRLHCGRCATAWAHDLRRCPDCHAGRLSMLNSLDTPAIGGWTLAGCDACRSYLKVAAEPRSERLGSLLLDDLESFRLDQLALAQGCQRPSGIGYRLEHGDVGGEDLDDD